MIKKKQTLRWLLYWEQNEGRKMGKQGDQLAYYSNSSWRKAMEWVGSKRQNEAKKGDSKLFGLSNWGNKVAVNNDGQDGEGKRFWRDRSKIWFWTCSVWDVHSTSMLWYSVGSRHINLKIEREHIWAPNLEGFSIQLVFKFRRVNEITKSLRKEKKNVEDSALRPSVIKRSDRGESSKGDWEKWPMRQK